MMSDNIQIELQEIVLAQLLTHAMEGIMETGEYTPALAHAFKELADKLPVTAWNSELIKEYAKTLDDNIEDDEDYPLTWDDEDWDEYAY